MKYLKKLHVTFSLTGFSLLCTSFLFILLRIPSLFEPYWYIDEGMYEVIGFAIRHGRLLYRDIWDQKPPLLYLLYALFDGTQLYLKLLSLCFGLIGLLLLYFLAQNLKLKPIEIIITIVSFTILFATPLFEGNTANAESFMIPIIIGAYLVCIYAINTKKNIGVFFIISGLLLGIAFLIKFVAIFDTLALIYFLFLTKISQKNIKEYLLYLFFFWSSFCLPLIATIIFFLSQHAVSDFFFTFFYNISYVKLHNDIFFVPFGLLFFKCFLLSIGCYIVWIIRRRVSPSSLFILCWVTFSLFNILFSTYNWTHYMLVLTPSFSLYAGICFFEKKYSGYKTLGFSLIVLFLMLFPHGIPLITYYTNFYKFITGQESVKSYRNGFSKKVNTDYAIAEFLKNKLTQTDRIMIWDSDAQVYRLLKQLPPGRFFVDFQIYLVNGALQETKSNIDKIHPAYIVIHVDPSWSFPYSLAGYTPIKRISTTVIYKAL